MVLLNYFKSSISKVIINVETMSDRFISYEGCSWPFASERLHSFQKENQLSTKKVCMTMHKWENPNKH